MRQAVIFIFSAIAITGVLAGVLFVAKHAKGREVVADSFSSSTYFQNSPDAFGLLQRNTSNQDSASSSSEPSQANREISVDSLIESWKRRPGAKTESTVRATPVTSAQTAPEADTYDLNALFKSLFGKKSAATANPNDNSQDANPFWFGGYTSTVEPVSVTIETEMQKSLRDYANAIATAITDFNQAQGDQTKVLDIFVKDRTNVSGLKELSNSYIAFSAKIATTPVPSQAETIQAGLVSSYKLVGELLWSLSTAGDDKDFLEKILTYNKASEKVASYHISLATLLKAYGVTFENSEPGSVFLFTGGL